MQTLIYKRTHSGDPDPETGVFGNHDCMGSVRAWKFDAVIGVGGIGSEPTNHGIAGRLTWVGIGPKRLLGEPDQSNGRGPRLRFEHFLYLGESGPLLRDQYPTLASRMYNKKVRVLKHSPLAADEDQKNKIAALDREVRDILRLGMAAPPSHQTTEINLVGTPDKCPPKSRGGPPQNFSSSQGKPQPPMKDCKPKVSRKICRPLRRAGAKGA
jgi:hypothetical protein